MTNSTCLEAQGKAKRIVGRSAWRIAPKVLLPEGGGKWSKKETLRQK
jgi:hypothetical protein